MSTDVASWLRGLGLEQYAAAFRDNAIDSALLSRLTPDDLKDLGVSLVGHRRRLLDAIAALKSSDDINSPAPHAANATAPSVTVRSSDAERRQLTVMFCDLVGSTALSVELDPEVLSDIIAAFQAMCVEAVKGFGGSIAKYMGDGVLVYFGYPEAHEDDAERAVRAGLALIDAMKTAPTSSRFRPRVRIGIATGLVVVGELIGEGSAQERVAVGETLNLAARIQAAASPDSIVVSELTRRLAGAAFEYEDLGARELKGIPDVTRLWRVAGESATRGRFDSRVVGSLTPLVGRAEEIALLRRRWDQAMEGDGQLILVSAPAGFGKSRITQAFREHLNGPSITCLQYFGSPFHVNSALYPFIGQLESAAGIARADTGGHILRVWSTDWWFNAEEAIVRLHAALNEALTASQTAWATPAAPVQALATDSEVFAVEEDDHILSDDGIFQSPPDEELNADNEPDEILTLPQDEIAEQELSSFAEAVTRAPRANFAMANLSGIKADPDCFFEFSYRPTLQAMVDAVMEAEAPVRNDVLAQRVARAHGWLRTGARIREQIAPHLRTLERTEETSGSFLWKPGTVASRVPFRMPEGPEHRRSLAEISIAELADFVITNSKVLDEDDPPLTYARLLRVERLAAPSRERIMEAIEQARTFGS